MCEILYRAVDCPGDESEVFKLHDIVQIQDDNYSWSPRERDSQAFGILKMPGVSKESVMHYRMSQQKTASLPSWFAFPEIAAFIKPINAVSKRCRYKVDVTSESVVEKDGT